jgi:serine/threonine-protein kinase
MSPSPETIFLAGGRFELVEHLGRGGSGDVYRALDHSLNSTVLAIKVYRSGLILDPNALAQMKAEIITARKVDHPSVIRLYEFYENEGSPFLTMEYIPGEPLSRVAEATRRAASTIGILEQLADALAAVHRVGIVHCDLKPGNVMLRPDGGVKLMDFGVAALHAACIEWPGECTPEWAPPELIRGERPTPAVDVYSFGLIAVRLLTGTADPHRISRIANKPLRAVVAKCVEGNPTRRYANGSDLKDALRLALETPVSSESRRWRWLLLAAALVVGALIGLPQLLHLWKPRPPAPAASVVPPAVPFTKPQQGSEPGSKPDPSPPQRPDLPSRIDTSSGPMILVAGGRFQMGYAKGSANEMPEHSVDVKQFYMDQYEVTAGRFNRIAGNPAPTANPDTPEMHLTWYAAERFCKAIGQRLPTEAEWEFAARGITGDLYPWGDIWKPLAANVQGLSAQPADIASVGEFSQDRTRDGLYDMLGNAPEWVADDYKPYADSASGWPSGRKTIRGAGITHTSGEIRLSVRDSAPPDRTGIIGFRCAADVLMFKGFEAARD